MDKGPQLVPLNHAAKDKKFQTTQLQLSGLEVYDGSQEIDAIYRISYPFEPKLVYPRVPIFLFFTSEFQVLRETFLSRGTLRDFETKLRSGDITAVTPSKWSAQAIHRTFGGTVGQRAIMVVPHGVDITIYHVLDGETRMQTRQKLGIPDSAFAYLSVGAMTPNKNTVGLLRAFYNLALLRNDVSLILKGVGTLHSCEQSIHSAIESLVQQCTLNPHLFKAKVLPRIVFIDTLYGYQQLCELYNAADCYVSAYLAEGFNIPVLEAMACGLPCIVSQHGATDDFVIPECARHPRTMVRYVVDARSAVPPVVLVVDELSLQETMLSVLLDPDFRASAKVSGPEHVAGRFTWDHVARSMMNGFEQRCGRPRPLRPFSEVLGHYRLRDGSSMPHTHTYFGNGGIKKLSIPYKELESAYASYNNYLCITSKTALCNGTGLNCLTERTQPVHRFFADIDIKMDALISGQVHYYSLGVFMRDMIAAFNSVLSAAFPGKDATPVVAWRMVYKCHLYFPGIFSTVAQSKAVCQNVVERLAGRYPWIVPLKVIDDSVYTSGLRILGSHKGAMSKSNAEIEKHTRHFGDELAYQSVYRLGDLDAESNAILYQVVTLPQLMTATIIVPPGATNHTSTGLIDTTRRHYYNGASRSIEILKRPISNDATTRPK
ncbi:hypothetical protein HDU81_008582 [Chytriomyces hyalinus]|nr:hypothetical protein HDU81_008582 [Chytriomyces hyalinus]